MKKLLLKTNEKINQILINSGIIGALCTMSGKAYANALDGEMKSAMNAVLGNILVIFKYVGVGLLIAGIVQLILAFKDDNADGKQRAIMLCGVAIALILIRTFLSGITVGGVSLVS